tara:strand:- start:13 stop:264 length:252 start_codon:yes stop_codon:yes gene_type:complete
MTEFTKGAFNILQKIKNDTSIWLALIYTAGHVVIAMTVVSVMTGASLWEAGAVALVEPTINGFWFYILHKLWAIKQEAYDGRR